MKTTPYTTTARSCRDNLTNIEVTFVENGKDLIVKGKNLAEFHQNWCLAMMPQRIKFSKVEGKRAAIYPTVIAFTPMATGYLTRGALAIVKKGEGRTFQSPQDALDAVQALEAMHNELGSTKEKKAYDDHLKAFRWTGKIID